MRAPESRDYDDRCETHVSLNIASLGVQEVKKKTWEFNEKKGETKCQEEFVSKWLKWTLGRRPGHRSIWTVFVSDGYDLFPSFRL